ncbi:MAG: signal recognition particle-docking protein FtsY [Nitrosopumilaceae archaeon]
MFDKLRNAFSDVAKSLGEKELKEKDIEEILFELEISLLESDVATEVIDAIKSNLKEKLIGAKVEKNTIESFVKESLIQSISKLFDDAGTIDLLANISAKKESTEPYIILFVGINGTGKTTTLAKLAHLLQKSKFSLVVAASDTFRAGAIEQLREHTNRLNLKLVAQNYGSDPAAVARDAVLYAKSHKVDCVLIDTAGRMQTSKNLMDQIEKITNVVKPDFKIFVGDSLAGNDTVNQAKEFHEYTKFNASILTKSDADARGGAALSIVKVTSTPVIFVGVGQEYEDLKPFDKNTFLETVFGSLDGISLESKEESEYTKETETPKIKVEEPVVEKTKEQEVIEEPETKVEESQKEAEIKSSSTDDPFEGIDTNDIKKYSDWYDVPSPETDQDAIHLANKIRKWISNDRPKPGESAIKEPEEESEKPKKRSLFGRFRK